MYKLVADNPKIAFELDEVVRLFFPDGEDAPEHISQTCEIRGNDMRVVVTVSEKSNVYSGRLLGDNESDRQRTYNRFNKFCMYNTLSELTKRDLPWGSLTGVRPTKLAYELIADGHTVDETLNILRSEYYVSDEKAILIGRILNAQKGFYIKDKRLINLYIHIPFCISRCSYCSFMTDIITPKYKLTEPYVEALTEEIKQTLALLKEKNYKVLSIYVGGGTPTALDVGQLKRVLKSVNSGDVEFTCEAGRPDTISKEKLSVMADCGVNRICINPQSLCDETLKRIGRNHSSRDFFEAFKAARSFPFSVNTDLIAGLLGETASVFEKTLKEIVELKPENVTVHTLARKNGSELRNSDYKFNDEVGKMVSCAYTALCKIGYEPYYVYRQKRMLGNLENTGYSLSGRQCINNITTMEECISVAACGAGAISKRVYDEENRIERLANLRDVKLYLEQFPERLTKKLIFLS